MYTSPCSQVGLSVDVIIKTVQDEAELRNNQLQVCVWMNVHSNFVHVCVHVHVSFVWDIIY